MLSYIIGNVMTSNVGLLFIKRCVDIRTINTEYNVHVYDEWKGLSRLDALK